MMKTCVAVNLSCFYISGGFDYICEGELLDGGVREGEVVTIVGDHADGYSDDDVIYFYNARKYYYQIIPKEIFEKFRNLIDFELRNMDLPNINNGAFNLCDELELIDLEQNLIKRIDADIFKKCEKLIELWLGENEISKVDDQAFAGLGRLQLLRLPTNRIKEISKDVFKPLGNLKQLDLKQNLIETLHTDTFNNLKSIEILNIAENSLIRLHVTTFVHCENLKQLLIQTNKIQRLPDELFQSQNKLQVLDISSNSIHRLDSKTFRSLTAVTKFSINNSSINVIDENLLTVMSSLTMLDLRNNKCVNKQFNSFSNQDSIKNDLVKCFGNFKPAFCEYFMIKDDYACKLTGVFTGDESSEEIQVNGEHLDGKTDNDVTIIRTVDSQLDVIPNMNSIKFPNIIKLNLWNAKIEILGKFNSPLNLSTLDFRFNLIEKITGNYFPINSMIEQLILMKNYVSTIDEDSFICLTKLSLLDIS